MRARWVGQERCGRQISIRRQLWVIRVIRVTTAFGLVGVSLAGWGRQLVAAQCAKAGKSMSALSRIARRTWSGVSNCGE